MPPINQITVFGGTGFVGHHLIRRLAKTGAIIRVPTRDLEKALPLKPMGDIGKIVPMYCNIRSDASVAQAIGPSDAVINLIGVLYEKRHDTFQTMHVETAARIARVARENGASHFAHLSALGASDASTSAYARSKAAGEQAMRMFFPTGVIVRPSIVFGPEDNFFNLFATLARYLPVLPLIGGGTTKFQPVYVGDVAEAIVEALRRPEAQGGIFELGGPQVYTFRELIELILRVTGRKRYLLNMPWPLAKTHAALHELLPLPRPLITRDQVELLKTDSVLRTPRTNGFLNLGISPTALEVILPTYLGRFRQSLQEEHA